MKKTVIFILAVIAFVACDKVENPNQNPPAVTNCPMNNPVIRTNTAVSGYRKVLVEDYTGHTCGNCPRAAEKIETMITTYGDSMVALAIHAGTSFAPPFPPDYPDDYRTAAGTDWDTEFGISAAGLPKGMVNRSPNTPQAYNTWPSLVGTNLHKPQTVKLDLTTTFDPVSLYLNVDVKATFLTALPNNVMLSVVVAEDSIVSDQKDYNESPDHVEDYEFEHMMRGSVNTNWGEVIKTTPILVNDTASKKYTCYKVECFNCKKLSVVAFAYDAVTKEVLQAEKLKLK